MVRGAVFLLPACAVLDSSPAWEGTDQTRGGFPAVLHQVEQGWFSFEVSVKKEDPSL